MNEKKRGGPRPNSGRKTKPEHERALKKMIVFTPEHWALVKDAPTRIVREALNMLASREDIALTSTTMSKLFSNDRFKDAPREFKTLEDVENAIKFYSKMIADNPRNIAVLNLCGNFLKQLYEFKKRILESTKPTEPVTETGSK